MKHINQFTKNRFFQLEYRRSRESILTSFRALPMGKKSPLSEFMSVRTLVYFEGSLEYYLESSDNDWETFPDAKQPKMSKTKPIELKQSVAMMLVMALGVSISLLVFAIELFCGTLDKAAEKRQQLKLKNNKI